MFLAMTRLEAMRLLVTAPRDHVDQARIGRVQKYATPDGRERMTYVVRVLKSVIRRVA
jgi:hypothetical protein